MQPSGGREGSGQRERGIAPEAGPGDGAPATARATLEDDPLATVAAAGLVNEVVVRPSQLPSVARAAAALPDATFVLDHLGKPPVASGRVDEWLELRAQLTAVLAS